MDYDQLVENLRNAGNSTRCSTLKKWLMEAGFEVKKGKRGNHHVITHQEIDGFSTGGFDCGHGKNSSVKKPYITKILNHIVLRYQNELREYMETRS